MLSEYGADAVEGVHSDPPIAFSEEFQAAYLRAHFGVFDELMQARESAPNPLYATLYEKARPPTLREPVSNPPMRAPPPL
jgi:hypothetical protein